MKIFLIILGAFLILLGAGCTLGGAATLAIVGSDGWAHSGTDQVDVRGAALVTGAEDIESEAAGDDFPGDVRLRIRAEMEDGSEVFIGVARASDATRYLQGAPLDVVDDLEIDPTEIETQFVPGTESLEPPDAQDFWLDSVSGGGRQELDWEVESGQFRFVVTPAEPREEFAVNVSAGVKLPFLRRVAIGLIVSGVIVLAFGVLLIVLGARRKDRTPPTDADVGTIDRPDTTPPGAITDEPEDQPDAPPPPQPTSPPPPPTA